MIVLYASASTALTARKTAVTGNQNGSQETSQETALSVKEGVVAAVDPKTTGAAR